MKKILVTKRVNPGKIPSRTAVIQPMAGIGDMVLLTPMLRALALSDASGRIDLFTIPKPPVAALLGREDIVARWSAIPMSGDALKRRTARNKSGKLRHLCLVLSELVGRIFGIFILIYALRAGRYEHVVILSTSWRYAFAAKMAGIPDIVGYGSRKQYRFLTRVFVEDKDTPPVNADDPCNRARRLLHHLRLPLAETPRLTVSLQAWEEIADRFAGYPQPWVAFGIGSADYIRTWPADRFAAIADRLWQKRYRSIFLIGAPHEKNHADAIVRECYVAQPLPVTDLSVDQVAALVTRCAFVFANDSGVMNLAAAVGARTYGMFSIIKPYTCWDNLNPITSPDGIMPRVGISTISIETAWAALEAHV